MLVTGAVLDVFCGVCAGNPKSEGTSKPKSSKPLLPLVWLLVTGLAGVTGFESKVVSNSPNASLRVDKRNGSSAESSKGAASWRPEKSKAPNVWDGFIDFSAGVKDDNANGEEGIVVP